MKTKEWVSLIEAGYNLDGTNDTWIEGVLDKAAPLFDRGFWPSVMTYRFTPTTVNVEHLVTRGPSQSVNFIHNKIVKASPEVSDIIYRSAVTITSLSNHVFSLLPGERAKFWQGNRGTAGDMLGVRAYTGVGSGLLISLAFLQPITPTAMERKRWPLMVSHLGAGLRLRSVARNFSFDNAPVEAILDPDGKLHDAREAATETSARESLKEAVRRIERARSRTGRIDPDTAMSNWEGLVQGRWSLVDRFDTDRRRFVVAIKNDPAHLDPRGLSARERQVAEYVGLGRSSKEISYMLGVSSSAVTNCTARAQAKLGLSSRTELATFFAPAGLRAKLAEVSIAGEELLVGAYPLVNENCVMSLTDAERTVLGHLLAGSTNSDIAQRRRTSDRTIANQVQSIFNKLKVRSRSELAARLQNSA